MLNWFQQQLSSRVGSRSRSETPQTNEPSIEQSINHSPSMSSIDLTDDQSVVHHSIAPAEAAEESKTDNQSHPVIDSPPYDHEQSTNQSTNQSADQDVHDEEPPWLSHDHFMADDEQSHNQSNQSANEDAVHVPTIDQSNNQSINPSGDRTDQLTSPQPGEPSNQSTEQSKEPIDLSNDQPTEESTNQSNNQSNNQSASQSQPSTLPPVLDTTAPPTPANQTTAQPATQPTTQAEGSAKQPRRRRKRDTDGETNQANNQQNTQPINAAQAAYNAYQMQMQQMQMNPYGQMVNQAYNPQANQQMKQFAMNPAPMMNPYQPQQMQAQQYNPYNQQQPMNPATPAYAYDDNNKRRRLDQFEMSDAIHALINENARLSAYVVEMSTALNLLNSHVRILAEREAERTKEDERRKIETQKEKEEQRIRKEERKKMDSQKIAEQAAKAAVEAALSTVGHRPFHSPEQSYHNETPTHANTTNDRPASAAYANSPGQKLGRPRKPRPAAAAPPPVAQISVSDLIPQLQSRDMTPAQKEQKLQEFKQRLQLSQATSQRPSVFL